MYVLSNTVKLVIKWMRSWLKNRGYGASACVITGEICAGKNGVRAAL